MNRKRKSLNSTRGSFYRDRRCVERPREFFQTSAAGDTVRPARTRRGAQKHGLAARGFTCQHVALGVTDHPRAAEVEIELTRELEEETWRRLAACALIVEVVRTVAERFDPAVARGELVLDPYLDLSQDALFNQPPCDSALVRDDRRGVTGARQ